jgi:hypothetical protein
MKRDRMLTARSVPRARLVVILRDKSKLEKARTMPACRVRGEEGAFSASTTHWRQPAML